MLIKKINLKQNKMKKNYINYPILEKLHKKSLGNMPMFGQDAPFFYLHGEAFVKHWKLNCEKFKQEINVISNPFLEASDKAQEKLMQLWKDIHVNDTSDFEVNGCYLVGDFVHMLSYEAKKGVETCEIAYYIFDKQGIPLAMYIDGVKSEGQMRGWISSCFSVNNNQDEIRNWIYYKIGQLCILKMFKSYAEVETKIMPPKARIKGFECKYINDTRFELTYLDSKWFTNLVKSDGFNVRGHFRLQPMKKDGKWTRELIWISEFSKTGYTAPARILSQTG
jgi:hypothetical protein